MSGRLLIGQHPILGMGMFISIPGLDVRSGSLPEHFLLATTIKNEQVLMTGVVFAPVGGTAVVFFPEPLPSRPIVTFIASISSGVIYYPYERELRPEQTWQVSAVCDTDRVTFINGTPAGQAFFFVVVARGF